MKIKLVILKICVRDLNAGIRTQENEKSKIFERMASYRSR